MPLPRDVSTNPLVLAKTLKHLASFASGARRRARSSPFLRASAQRAAAARAGGCSLVPGQLARTSKFAGLKRQGASDAGEEKVPTAPTPASDAGEEKVEVPAAQL